jgi:hypothetical protein
MLHIVNTPALGAIQLNVQPWSLTIGDNLRATFVVDREGRPVSCFLDGRNYRFGLSGAILVKAIIPGAPKLRRLLAPAEGDELRVVFRGHLARIAAGLAATLDDETRGRLALALDWDDTRVAADQAQFQRIYKPISIVPPDQYRAVVLQVTEGCSWNRCTFCSFYRDRSFRVKTPTQLREHIRQIKALLGRGLGLRRSIFLGDANALIVPQSRLLELLEVIHEELPGGGPGQPEGLYAFLDIFGAEQKSEAQYAELRARGVQRVYIGLESGDEEVFRLLNKPGSPQQCVTTVARIKAAGLHVGIIVLAGPGGATLAERHVAGSLAAIAAMGLGAGDLVYLSPLIAPDDGEYTRQARALGLTPLGAPALDAQLEELRRGARGATGGRAQAALYHIEEWLY